MATEPKGLAVRQGSGADLMRRLWTPLALACFAFAARSANAEAERELAIGGLVFTLTAGVELSSEDVSLTLTSVDFAYELVNGTGQPADLGINLRLPDVDLGDLDATDAMPVNDPVNFTGAQIAVDGAPLPIEFEQVAMLRDTDVTSRLREAGLPFLLSGNEGRRVIAELPPDLLKTLIEEGLLTSDGVSPDGPTPFFPAWRLKTRGVVHRQVQAGHRVTVTLRSMASVGSSPDTVLRKALRQNETLRAEADRYRRTYCVTDSFLGGVDKVSGIAEANEARWEERRIDLDLPPPTGQEKSVPTFHLSIDKGRPENLISTCADKLKKTSPTRFEATLTDAMPPLRLHVLVLQRP